MTALFAMTAQKKYKNCYSKLIAYNDSGYGVGFYGFETLNNLI